METLLNIIIIYVIMVVISFVVITYFENFFCEPEAEEVLIYSFFWPIILILALLKILVELFTKIHEKLPRRNK